MVLRYTIIPVDKELGYVEHPLNPTREPESKSSIPPASNDGQLTPPCVVSDARSGWENVGHGHVNINGVARDGKRSDSKTRSTYYIAPLTAVPRIVAVPTWPWRSIVASLHGRRSSTYRATIPQSSASRTSESKEGFFGTLFVDKRLLE
jgi:hypothetical protein